MKPVKLYQVILNLCELPEQLDELTCISFPTGNNDSEFESESEEFESDLEEFESDLEESDSDDTSEFDFDSSESGNTDNDNSDFDPEWEGKNSLIMKMKLQISFPLFS